MLFEEIIPHLNKLASLVFTNNKRRVGFIFLDQAILENNEYPDVIYFLSVSNTRFVLDSEIDMEKIKELREEIPLSDIRKIKSVN